MEDVLDLYAEPADAARPVVCLDAKLVTRTRRDYARQLQWLADEYYPDVQVIRLVQDNLNIHRLANLYLAFPAAEARRLVKRLRCTQHRNIAVGESTVELEIGII